MTVGINPLCFEPVAPCPWLRMPEVHRGPPDRGSPRVGSVPRRIHRGKSAQHDWPIAAARRSPATTLRPLECAMVPAALLRQPCRITGSLPRPRNLSPGRKPLPAVFGIFAIRDVAGYTRISPSASASWFQCLCTLAKSTGDCLACRASIITPLPAQDPVEVGDINPILAACPQYS